MTWLYVPSASVPASEGSTSASASLDPTRAASLSWRGKLQQPQAWSRAWKRGGFIRLLSGLTCEPSTLEHGVAQWIASCRAIPAKETASPESASASSTIDGCSTVRSTSTIKAGLLCSSAKTYRGTSPDNSKSPSQHWSDWGAALRQEYSARPRPEPITDASDSSSWPTAKVSSGGYEVDARRNPPLITPTLAGAAEQWETPSVAVTTGTRLARSGDRSSELLLTGQAIACSDEWRTPQAGDATRGNKSQRGSSSAYKDQAGRHSLVTEVAAWHTRSATPATAEAGDCPTSPPTTLKPADTATAAAPSRWPSPMARDHKGGGQATERSDGKSRMDMLDWRAEHWQPSVRGARAFAMTDLLLPDRPTPSGPKSSETRRRLNPLFVEWLMGWPEGLSGFDTAGTASCHSPQPSRGCACMDCWLTTQRAMLSALLMIAPPMQPTLL